MALKIEPSGENFQEKGTVYLSIARGKSPHLRHKKRLAKASRFFNEINLHKGFILFHFLQSRKFHNDHKAIISYRILFDISLKHHCPRLLTIASVFCFTVSASPELL